MKPSPDVSKMLILHSRAKEEKRSEGLVAAVLTGWSILLSVSASQMLLGPTCSV